jgi:hypothetical protein
MTTSQQAVDHDITEVRNRQMGYAYVYVYVHGAC